MKKLVLIALLLCLKQLNAQCSFTISGDTVICAGTTTTLTANGATNYTWMPSGSNSSSIAVTPTATTVYTVTGTTGTCTATNTISVTVYPTPTVDAVPNSFYCPNQVTNPIIFNCQPTGGTPYFNWTISSHPNAQYLGNIPSYTVINNTSSSIITTYTVYAILNNCTGPTSTFSVTFYPSPVAKFRYNGHICDGSPMQFTDLSTPTSGSTTVNSWQWDFNSDGTTDATGQNPQYLLPSAGEYSVTLLVGTNTAPSCTAHVTEQVFVNPKPVPNFIGDALQGCSNLDVNFSNLTSISAPSKVLSYTWNFGNGNTSNQQTPFQQVYTNSSTTQNVYYTVSLMATSDSGCVSTTTKTNYIEVLACAGNGIEKYSGSNEVNIYPNPSNDNFVIETTSAFNQTLQIIDVTGKLVLQQIINGKAIIDASSLDNGIYFVQINTGDNFFTKKIILQR